ncbi:MAG: hypothetical protein ACI4JF_03080 [Oscillospiraceae bacterium]
MAVLALLGGIWCIFVALRGKGKAFTSKMGTPLTGKEAKPVKYTNLIVGILLIIVAAVSGVRLLLE